MHGCIEGFADVANEVLCSITVECPIICSFCGITILRFTFYIQNDDIQAGGIILFFPAALVMMPPVDVRLAAGVGTLELLVLMPDIAWLVCRVIFDRQK